MPVASVIMPCYNHAKFVVESARAVLNQSFSDLELILVDDGSRDGSVELIQDLAREDSRVNAIIQERNFGASHSRNVGLKVARGDYVGFCDADDVWKRDKLKLQIELLTTNPRYDVTYCESEIIDERGQPTGIVFSDLFPQDLITPDTVFERLCQTNFINTQTVLLRRHCIEEDGYFDESIKWVEDWWLWIRLARKHRFLYDSRVLAQYRTHGESTRLTQKRSYRVNRWKVGKRNLRTHKDLRLPVQSMIWYNMAVDLFRLRKPRCARRFLVRALYLGLRGGSFIQSPARIAARLFREALVKVSP
jgi:glycosyltransferase involved in cell wall biosynthesis